MNKIKTIAVIIVILLLIPSVLYVGFYATKQNRNSSSRKSTKITNKQSDNNSAIDAKDLLITNNEGNISVGISYMNPIEDDKDNLVFQVFLDNHELDLSKINLKNKVIFSNSDGLKLEHVQWYIEGSGHHVTAFIKVPKKVNGKNVITKNTRYIELEVKDIGGVKSRIYKWNDKLIGYRP